MGKPTTTQNNGFINHFSHPHRLQLTPTASSPPCSACKLFGVNGRSYTCRPCNFSLHESCSKMKQVITHPSHPSHSLNLLVAPVYDGGCFNCDACGVNGTGFSYQCARCDFDIHALCAYKPLSIIHNSHPHTLKLVFQSPYGASKGFSCDICLQIGKNQWIYRCIPCEFDAHVGCITAPHPHVLQHTVSAPGPRGHPPHQDSLPMHGQGNNRPRTRPMTKPQGTIRNPNRPIAQNLDAYGPRRENNIISCTGQVGPFMRDELISQVGQSLGQGSVDGSSYDGIEGNNEVDGGVSVEVEYDEGLGEANDDGEGVEGNEFEIVVYGNDDVSNRSESEFGGSSYARSQCHDLADADLYPLSLDNTQGPVPRIDQGSRGGKNKNTNRNDPATRSKNTVCNGTRCGLQGSKTKSPRGPQTRNVQNVRKNGRRANEAVSVRVNRSRVPGPAASIGPQGVNGASGGPSNDNYNYKEVDASDSYVGEDCYEEGYGDEFVGVNFDCEFEAGGDFEGDCDFEAEGHFEVDCEFETGGYSLEDGDDDDAYDENYGENDFKSYSDFTGVSESMYDGNCRSIDDSQYIRPNEEPNNQYSPMVGAVGRPSINNQNMYNQTGRPMNRRMNGRGDINMYGNMNQGVNKTQPRTIDRPVQYKTNGEVYRVNEISNGPNGFGNTLVNTMVQGLCQDFAMNMLGGGGDVGGGVRDVGSCIIEDRFSG